MHPVAKAIIIIPLVIVSTAVTLRITGAVSRSSTSDSPVVVSVTPVVVTPIPTTFSAESRKPISSNVKLNLTGPLTCSYSTTDMDIKLFIKDRNVYAKMINTESTSFFLIAGDCGYRWADGEKSGMKICNLKQYLSLVETVSSMPFFSTEMLFSFLPKSGGDELSLPTEAISRVLNSCKKLPIDDDLFQLPRNIQFLEQKLTGTPEELFQ